jgi:hypothetical protein
VANQTAQQGGDSHNKKINFKIEESPFGFARLVDSECINKTEGRHKQIGSGYYGLVNPNSPKIYGVYFIHCRFFSESER